MKQDRIFVDICEINVETKYSEPQVYYTNWESHKLLSPTL